MGCFGIGLSVFSVEPALSVALAWQANGSYSTYRVITFALGSMTLP
jgi:hypothetical protein